MIGLILFFNPHTLLDPIHLGSAPKWSDLVFALTVAVISFTSLESASGPRGGGADQPRAASSAWSASSDRRRWSSSTSGIALVAVTALPVHAGHTELARPLPERPRDRDRRRRSTRTGWRTRSCTWWRRWRRVTLMAAANSAMLGLSRLAYSLSTNRQIPSGLGRLHPQRSTPYVLIILAGLLAAALVVPEDLDFLVGIYAFGAMLAFTIAHLSICRLRYTEPDRDRPYRVPLSMRVRGGELPLPAVFGALVCGAGWVAVMVAPRTGALRRARLDGRSGSCWYVVYRRADETSLLQRVTVSPQILRAEPPAERDYGSILVPLFGTDLDDDIVQTAALLVAGEPTDEAAIDERRRSRRCGYS